MGKQATSAGIKIFYLPIEAAIRWSGLIRQEAQILKILPSTHSLRAADIKRWPRLELNVARIFDGLVNGDLPYGKNGVTANDHSLLSSPHLTIRHLDLRKWMSHHYPAEKPAFLFDESERIACSCIDIDTVRALLTERDASRAQLEICTNALQQLRREHTALHDQFTAHSRNKAGLHPRGENTYVNIIGAMLSLLLGQSPSGAPYSAFKTQESIISALIAHHGDVMGITERTLQTKFAEGKRRITDPGNARP